MSVSSLRPSVPPSPPSSEEDCGWSQCRARPVPMAGPAQCGGSVPGTRGPLVRFRGTAVRVLGPHGCPCPEVPEEGHQRGPSGPRTCQGLSRNQYDQSIKYDGFHQCNQWLFCRCSWASMMPEISVLPPTVQWSRSSSIQTFNLTTTTTTLPC